MKGNSVLFAAVLVCAILGAAVGGAMSFSGSYQEGTEIAARLQEKRNELVRLMRLNGKQPLPEDLEQLSAMECLPARASTDAASSAFLGGVAGACLGLCVGFGARVIV